MTLTFNSWGQPQKSQESKTSLPQSVTISDSVKISGEINVKMTNVPTASTPLDVKMVNETRWIWSEAGAAWVAFLATLAALGVSYLAYRVVREQNVLLKTQGDDQIALLKQQNGLQEEMARWQQRQGEQQDKLSAQQFNLQEQVAIWQRASGEVELFDRCMERFLAAVDNFNVSYSEPVIRELSQWKKGGHYSSFDGAKDAINERYEQQKVSAEKRVFHSLEVFSLYIRSGSLRDRHLLVILDQPVKTWYHTLISNHHQAAISENTLFPELQGYAQDLIAKERHVSPNKEEKEGQKEEHNLNDCFKG